jgi:hypothetical protein
MHFENGVVVVNLKSRCIGSWSQSYHFGIYTYNTIVVVGYSVFTKWKIIFIPKMRYAISLVVSFYNAGDITRDRRIGSWSPWIRSM